MVDGQHDHQGGHDSPGGRCRGKGRKSCVPAAHRNIVHGRKRGQDVLDHYSRENDENWLHGRVEIIGLHIFKLQCFGSASLFKHVDQGKSWSPSFTSFIITSFGSLTTFFFLDLHEEPPKIDHIPYIDSPSSRFSSGSIQGTKTTIFSKSNNHQPLKGWPTPIRVLWVNFKWFSCLCWSPCFGNVQ